MSRTGLRLSQEQFDALQKRTPRKPTERVVASLNRRESKLESLLASQIEWAGLRKPVREYCFAPPRKWRIDFAWHTPGTITFYNPHLGVPSPPRSLAVEIQGGCHTVRARWLADIEKSQALLLAGWRVLYLSPDDVKSGRAISLIEQALKL